MPRLAEIIDEVNGTLPALRARTHELELAAARAQVPPSFAKALRGDQVAVIAEVKRRSPSAGAINESLDPASLASEYAEGGAAAISVLTEGRFFGGSVGDLKSVVAAVRRPVLRKDFILDEVQLLEARASGAAAALLIVRALDQPILKRLSAFAADIGIAVLVEVHTHGELLRALEIDAAIIGVNARDLDSFAVNPSQTWPLFGEIPSRTIAVAESGMSTVADVTAAAAAGADAVLVGTSLARSSDPRSATAALSGVQRHAR